MASTSVAAALRSHPSTQSEGEPGPQRLSRGPAVRASIQACCPACGGMVEIPYILLGAPIVCPSCGKTAVPEVPVGTVYPRTEYEITFRDFQQLLSNSSYRPSIGELLVRWFDYEVRVKGETAVVRSRRGQAVDLLELHPQIQEDSAKQHAIYKTAMAFWR